jgi:hypothetical protein
MATNYDGLTRNVWPGTWSTGTNSPIVIDTEVRGTLQSISGDSGDRLTDIPGARITEGMLVYVKNGYTSGSTTYTADKYYTYKLQGSEVRSSVTGAVPNADANWSLFSVGGGSGYTGSAGAIGFTGSAGAVGFTGSAGAIGYSGSKGDQGTVGFSGSKGDIGYSGSKGDTGTAGAIGYSGSKGDTGTAGAIGYSGSKGDQGVIGYTGSIGFSGSKGDIGYSGSKGDTGTTGADGLDGAVGFSGSKGDIGYSGSKGDQGIIGYTGSKGDQGDQGVIGYTGSIGFSGSKGDQGIIGYTGSEGNLDIAVASTPPVSAGIGDVWIDDATGIQYFYMNDGNSNQWVELSNQGVVGFTGSAGASTLSSLTDVTISTPQKGHTLVYDGSGWVQTQTPISQFVVTANGSSAYRFDGAGFPSTSGDNPTIYLKKGQTYYFRNTTSGHPFRIQSTTGTGGTVYDTGVTDNNASGSTGVVIFHVPMSAPATLYYQCSSHGSMVGTITIV